MALQTISDLPYDLRLQLALHVAVADLFGLLATCTVFRELQHERALWWNAIQMIELTELHPVAAPNSADMTAVELKACVLRAYRLLCIRDGSVLAPKLVRIGQFRDERGGENTENQHESAFFLPKTSLVVVKRRQDICCWDVVAQRVLGSVEVFEGLRMSCSTPLIRVGDEFFVAAFIRGENFRQIKQLAVISIHFGVKNDISIRVDRSAVVPTLHGDFKHGPFLGDRFMGFCGSEFLVVWNLQPNSPVTVRRHFMPVVPRTSAREILSLELPLADDELQASTGSLAYCSRTGQVCVFDKVATKR
ncbi:hypothetical protein MKEN_01329600 [Mycena kentingensis (nom. inval.)]|nr:hypothetical protein MKEN_01329600 [Mycena kentingensis (nom. inval.)]